jgi:hypothetical protein
MDLGNGCEVYTSNPELTRGGTRSPSSEAVVGGSVQGDRDMEFVLCRDRAVHHRSLSNKTPVNMY